MASGPCSSSLPSPNSSLMAFIFSRRKYSFWAFSLLILTFSEMFWSTSAIDLAAERMERSFFSLSETLASSRIASFSSMVIGRYPARLSAKVEESTPLVIVAMAERGISRPIAGLFSMAEMMSLTRRTSSLRSVTTSSMTSPDAYLTSFSSWKARKWTLLLPTTRIRYEFVPLT